MTLTSLAARGRVLHRHFDILAQFEAKVADNPEFKSLGSREKWEAMATPLRLLTLQMAMKVLQSFVLVTRCPEIQLPGPELCIHQTGDPTRAARRSSLPGRRSATWGTARCPSCSTVSGSAFSRRSSLRRCAQLYQQQEKATSPF